MKKILCLCLVTALAAISLCFAACDIGGTETLNEKTPYELYTAASEYVKNNIGYSVTTETATATGTITMSDGSTMDFSLESKSEAVRNNRSGIDDSMNVRITDSTDMNFEYKGQKKTQSTESDVRFVGGRVYIDTSETSYKGYADISYEEFLSIVYGSMGIEASSDSEAIMAVAETSFRGVKFHRDGDLYYCDVDVDKDAQEEMAEGFRSSFGEMLGITKSAEIKIVDTYIKICFDSNGILVNTVSGVEAEVELNGNKVKMNYEVVSTYTFDNVPDVTAPADADEYEDMTDELREAFGT